LILSAAAPFWQLPPNLWQAVAMGNKDARSREKKKPKKQPAPKVYQPTVSTVVKPTAPKT
jgi:hypothetical protein